jgi:hypothetical protein
VAGGQGSDSGDQGRLIHVLASFVEEHGVLGEIFFSGSLVTACDAVDQFLGAPHKFILRDVISCLAGWQG